MGHLLGGFLKDKLTVLIFWDKSEHASDKDRKERTINAWGALCKRLEGLDSSDLGAVFTVVRTPYYSWAKQTIIAQVSLQKRSKFAPRNDLF